MTELWVQGVTTTLLIFLGVIFVSTASSLVQTFIEQNPSVSYCLYKQVLNYSAMVRMLIEEVPEARKFSSNALLIALQRLGKKRKSKSFAHDYRAFFQQSSVVVRNKIFRITTKRDSDRGVLAKIHHQIDAKQDLLLFTEGSKSVTTITEEKQQGLFAKLDKRVVVEQEAGLQLIIVHSPGIEQVQGAISHLTGLFALHDVNIKELLSCYDESIFLIDPKDAETVMGFLS